MNGHMQRLRCIANIVAPHAGIAAGELEKVFDPFYRGEAGTGTAGYTGDTGPATSAQLHYPAGGRGDRPPPAVRAVRCVPSP